MQPNDLSSDYDKKLIDMLQPDNADQQQNLNEESKNNTDKINS